MNLSERIEVNPEVVMGKPVIKGTRIPVNPVCEVKMKYRAILKQSGEWWIGWLVDLPGVNAQEKSRDALIESLIIGAEDMLSTEAPLEPEAMMTTIEIPEPAWMAS